MKWFSFGKSDPNAAPKTTPQLYKNRKEIIAFLKQSKDTGMLLGIYADVVGTEMHVTAVKDLFKENGEVMVTFHQHVDTRVPLRRQTFSVDEIKMLCPFEESCKNGIAIEKIKRSIAA